jgi:hypothetical protein
MDYERLCASAEAFVYAAIDSDGEAPGPCLRISRLFPWAVLDRGSSLPALDSFVICCH